MGQEFVTFRPRGNIDFLGGKSKKTPYSQPSAISVMLCCSQQLHCILQNREIKKLGRNKYKDGLDIVSIDLSYAKMGGDCSIGPKWRH